MHLTPMSVDMADELSCPDCDKQIESADDLEREEVPQIGINGDDSISLFESNDLFLCKECKNALGIAGSN